MNKNLINQIWNIALGILVLYTDSATGCQVDLMEILSIFWMKFCWFHHLMFELHFVKIA